MCVYVNLCYGGPFPLFDPEHFSNSIKEIPQKHLFQIQNRSLQEQTTISSSLTSPFLSTSGSTYKPQKPLQDCALPNCFWTGRPSHINDSWEGS